MIRYASHGIQVNSSDWLHILNLIFYSVVIECGIIVHGVDNVRTVILVRQQIQFARCRVNVFFHEVQVYVCSKNVYRE